MEPSCLTEDLREDERGDVGTIKSISTILKASHSPFMSYFILFGIIVILQRSTQINMLTSTLIGLVVSLSALTGQSTASPILARQVAHEGVPKGHDVQGIVLKYSRHRSPTDPQASVHTTMPSRPTGTILAARTGISTIDSGSAAAGT